MQAQAARVCRDLLRLLPACLACNGFSVTRRSRVPRCAPNAPKVQVAATVQLQVQVQFRFGVQVRCVACRPVGRVALAACGPQFVNN